MLWVVIRKGLIDVAVKTSETGCVQRKLVYKGVKNIRVCFDYRVRNAKWFNCLIISFLSIHKSVLRCQLSLKRHLGKYFNKKFDYVIALGDRFEMSAAVQSGIPFEIKESRCPF